MDFDAYLAQRRKLVDQALDEFLPPVDVKPKILHQAMRYSLFAGGKRVRPILAMAGGEAVGGVPESLLPLGVSLECIHTYSLIHDDLPAMDDDDLRRGKPAAHKAFGEAVAILAGDALLTFAFGLLTSPRVARMYRSDRLLRAISELAVAAGHEKLVAGQVADITSEGTQPARETVEYIVQNKTGALIRASLTCGAILAGGGHDQIDILGRYGANLGAVFQIRDDLLDLEGDPEKLGKAVHKDDERGKLTFPNLLGRQKTRELMRDLLDSALETIEPLGEKALPLVHLARYIGDRID
jgi:geranylgeranyl diphosphate synthase type II